MRHFLGARRPGIVERRDSAKERHGPSAIQFLIALLGALCPLATGRVEARSDEVKAAQCLPVGQSASQELRELGIAAELLRRSGYFGNIMRTSGVRICVDPLMMLFHGYYEPAEHVIVIRGNATPAEKALVLAHELRHVDQAARGFAPSLEYDIGENIRQLYALEADAEAATALFAWYMREVGDPSLWQALKRLEHVGDIAARFETVMRTGAGQAAAMSAAFSTWYESRWRIERHFRTGSGAYLDQLDESNFVQSYRKWPRGYFQHLCLMPSGNEYACRLPE